MESGLIKTLRVLAKKRHASFEWDEILECSGAEADKTALALDYLARKELIQSTPEGGHWKLTDGALTVVDAMLSIDRGAKRRRSSAGLRVALSSRPLDMKTFMEKVKEEGFSRRDGLRFLSRERRRGYLKEARLLFVGSQKDEIESCRKTIFRHALIEPDFRIVDLALSFISRDVVGRSQNDVNLTAIGFPACFRSRSPKKMVGIIYAPIVFLFEFIGR